MTLEAVQEAAVADASAEADAIRRGAHERAEQVLAGARAEAAALLAERRGAAERLADLEERERLAQARAQARATVLRAQQAMLTEAVAAVRSAAHRLVEDRRYRQVVEQLAADARERLPDPVEIVRVPAGGFIARAGSRQIDYSLDAQVDRCLAAMADELERLWR